MKTALFSLLACTAILALACSIVGQLAQPTEKLNGKRVAILAADGFEEAELFEPKKALDGAGAKTTIVSPEAKEVKGWKEKQWGKSIAVDVPLASAKADQFDALLLPGGV